MKLFELLNLVVPDTTVWLQKPNGTYLEANERGCLSHKYTGYRVVKMYAERYPAIGCMGITVEIEPESEDDFRGAEIILEDGVKKRVIEAAPVRAPECYDDFTI